MLWVTRLFEVYACINGISYVESVHGCQARVVFSLTGHNKHSLLYLKEQNFCNNFCIDSKPVLSKHRQTKSKEIVKVKCFTIGSAYFEPDIYSQF